MEFKRILTNSPLLCLFLPECRLSESFLCLLRCLHINVLWLFGSKSLVSWEIWIHCHRQIDKGIEKWKLWNGCVERCSHCISIHRKSHYSMNKIVVLCGYHQGRVKKVLENYTQNFTAPTVGFDCHVSEDLSSVSAKTSSFLAFERTQVRGHTGMLWYQLQFYLCNNSTAAIPTLQKWKCIQITL